MTSYQLYTASLLNLDGPVSEVVGSARQERPAPRESLVAAG